MILVPPEVFPVLIWLPAIGGLLAWFLSRFPAAARWSGAVGAVAGGIPIAIVAAQVLASGETWDISVTWSAIGYTQLFRLDALAAFFLLPVGILGALCAVFGVGYLHEYDTRSDLGWTVGMFGVLISAMAVVVVARDVLGFLFAWEMMALSSFFLVIFEDSEPENRTAGWTYLVAGHLGLGALLVFFLTLSGTAGSTDFSHFTALSLSPLMRGGLFLLALFGFGTKAGLVPLHVWLPEAHPAAPSHVSALMSGGMVKMGIYGILRTLPWFGPGESWQGILLIVVGLAGGLYGVIFAIAQDDLKKTLAYSTVENIGIIILALGVAIYSKQQGEAAAATIATAGMLLHIWNHALLKGALFCSAGVVLQATGTRNMNLMGGLLKTLPWTGNCALAGMAGICGLPPMSAFLGEFLIYLALLRGLIALSSFALIPLIVALGGLALIGGLAAACFSRVMGVIFLGEPRREIPTTHSPSLPMNLAIVIFLLLSFLAIPGYVFRLSGLSAIISTLSGGAPKAIAGELVKSGELLGTVVLVFGILLLTAAALAWGRRRLLSDRTVEETGTWDCGYARPQARMSYTASSFSEPLIWLFRSGLRPHIEREPITELFPGKQSYFIGFSDLLREKLIAPVLEWIAHHFIAWRWLQHGRIQLYVLYILLTLLGLMGWNLW
jgi:hydrogenase-4 component B